MKKIICSLLSIGALIHSSYASFEDNLTVFTESKCDLLMQDVAQEIIKTVQAKPDATIVLPYGESSAGVYRSLQVYYASDPLLDLSQATWLLPGEYLQYPKDHPLSVGFFIETYFLDPLKKIDEKRAPVRIKLPQKLETIIDLSVLDLGPAYPEMNEHNEVALVGGNIAFNEPGTDMESTCRKVWVSPQLKSSLNHKINSMRNLQAEGCFVDCTDISPESAISLGLEEIYNSNKVIVLALGEDRAPILQQIRKSSPNSQFPATYLYNHPNIKWFVDVNAISEDDSPPWRVEFQGIEQDKYFNIALCALSSDIPASKISIQEITKTGYTIKKQEDIIRKINDFQTSLIEHIGDEELPYNKNILIISPHPDDDVISMSGTVKKLSQRKNKITILYAVSGSNSIREDLPDYKKALTQLATKDDAVNSKRAKEIVRENEAIAAVSLLSVSQENLIFFRAEYYDRRGIPSIDPISEKDLSRMVTVLQDLKPEYIFFAAENDPHGAHGISTQLVAEAIKKTSLYDVKFWGYRGAYNEWPLYDPSPLTIIPLSEDDLDLKVAAIKAHKSQLNPLYPSADKREFYERAKDRNQLTARKLNNLLDTQDFFAAEVFKEFSYSNFLELYEARS